MKCSMALAVYPGSFDPITNGHLDIVGRARAIFARVEVVVAENAAKDHLFPLHERLRLVRASLDHCGWMDVEASAHGGLMVDLLRERGAKVMIRGLRASRDFEYEFGISLLNRRLWPEAETVYLPTREEFMGVHSTMVREVARLGGPIGDLVTGAVAEALHARFGPEAPR